MYRTLMKSKIHRATITRTDLNYVGSITIDKNLMQAANFVANERVQIVNLNNGERFETYVIVGEAGSGAVELNGAAARLAEAGDIVIIISYGQYSETECEEHQPTVVLVDARNRITDLVQVEQN